MIIAIHGGAFKAGDKEDVTKLFGPVMSQTDRGFAVFAINYRLVRAGRNLFPTAIRDASEAVKWVRAKGTNYGLNPTTLIIAGHSAGGSVAALVGTGSNSPGASPLGRVERVDGWVSMAGILDFTAGESQVRDLRQIWLGTNYRNHAWASAASAVSHIDSNDPPGYIVHGDRDSVVPFTQLEQMIGVAGSKGITRRLYHDRVDTGGSYRYVNSQGASVEVTCRWHLPMCAMNVAVFNSWVDRVAARNL